MRKIILIFIFLFLYFNLYAGKMNNWIFDDYYDFFQGEWENLEIDETGKIRLTYPMEVLNIFEGFQGWSIEYLNENIYVGTSTPAQLLKYDISNNTTDTILSFEEGSFFSLYRKSNTVYAALSPQGIVFKYHNGIVDTLFQMDSLVIWDMCSIPGEKLVLATGNRGYIYIINSNGAISDSICTYEDAVVSVIYRNDSLYAGTSGMGYLISIDLKNNDLFVLHDPPGEEVNVVFFDRTDNLIYASISGSVEIYALSSMSTTIEPEFSMSPSSSELTSNIYIYNEGQPRILWQTVEPPIMDFFNLPDDRLAVVGSPYGNIFILDIKKHVASVAKYSDENLISDVVSDENTGKTYFLTVNPPAVFVVSGNYSIKGEYTSPVLNAGYSAIWGNLIWKSSGNVRMQARVGNTSEPDDEFWTDWTGLSSDNSGICFSLPKSSYFQFRSVFERAGTLSELDKVEFLYSTDHNIPPVIQSIEVYAPGVCDGVILNGEESIEMGIFTLSLRNWCQLAGWTIPNNPITIPERWQGVFWRVDDPNADSLKYCIFIKRKRDGFWIKLKENLKLNCFTFNSLYFEDGFYSFKIIASDEISNNLFEMADTAESEYFIIDNSPPVFTDYAYNNDVITFVVKDELSRITECHYDLGDSHWISIQPDDGVFDENIENFTVEVNDEDENVYKFSAMDRSRNVRFSFYRK